MCVKFPAFLIYRQLLIIHCCFCAYTYLPCLQHLWLGVESPRTEVLASKFYHFNSGLIRSAEAP